MEKGLRVLSEADYKKFKAAVRQIEEVEKFQAGMQKGYVALPKSQLNSMENEIKILRQKKQQYDKPSHDLMITSKALFEKAVLREVYGLLTKKAKQIYDDFEHRDVWCLPPDEYREILEDLKKKIGEDDQHEKDEPKDM